MSAQDVFDKMLPYHQKTGKMMDRELFIKEIGVQFTKFLEYENC